MRSIAAAAAIAAVLSFSPAGAAAQIRGSEAASVGQTVDGTKMTITYSRPSARGRELFGELVSWGRAWTGANWATTFEADEDVILNGVDVPAGKYSVWMVPRPDRWRITLHPEPELFHTQAPDSTDEQVHVFAEPEETGHTELLTWTFDGVSGDAALLRMRWGTTAVPLRVVVQPSQPVELAQEIRDAYVGAWDLTVAEGLPWPREARFEVWEEDGLLRGSLPFPIHEGDETTFDLVPGGRDRFNMGLYRDGKLFNVEMGGVFEFEIEDGRATVVRLRALDGTVFAEGRRAGE